MKILFTFLFLLPSLLFAQKKYTLAELVPVDSATYDIVYQAVVEATGVTIADLYSRAKTFYLKTFNNTNAVIQADEKDKRVAGKSIIGLPTRRKASLLAGLEESQLQLMCK